VDVVDREVDDALARSFLVELPTELAGRLRGEGERADYPAGTTVYRAGSAPQAALVVRGLIRVYLSSPGGRQLTVRYARPGDVLGIAVLVGGPANVGVQTVEPSSVLRISARALTAAARRDPRVSWAIAEELNRRQRSNVPGVTNRLCRRCLESSRVNAESTARSGQEGRGRATCRRKTATSCRNTRISAFLDACLRASSASQLMS
jgi:CRP-like cAMP-binding protein